MPLALAIDTVCNREFPEMPADQATVLKFAMMMRMGIDDPIAMLAAVEGCERQDWKRHLAVAGVMLGQPQQAGIFAHVEACARQLMAAMGAAA